jgi:hypothetical protein
LLFVPVLYRATGKTWVNNTVHMAENWSLVFTLPCACSQPSPTAMSTSWMIPGVIDYTYWSHVGKNFFL